MSHSVRGAGQRDVRAFRDLLLAADDEKIARILAVVEQVSDPKVNQALLDPLRARLAALKPGRPLRFARLLFIPLDQVIVAARDWKPGDPAVPRTALSAMSGAVRNGLGAEVAPIDALIEGRKTDAVQVVARAGEMLWPRAAEILDTAPLPEGWLDTGLRTSVWPTLSRSVATVLRYAIRLRSMMRDAEIGAIEADGEIVLDLLRNTVNEAPEGCAMLARLILEQLPHAASLLGRILASSGDAAEKLVLRQAVATGMDQVLAGMETPRGIASGVGQGALGNVAGEVRRITTLLSDIEDDSDAAKHKPRVKAIRDMLDEACRARFSDGIREELVMPLTASSGPVDRTGQTRLETSARDLRALEKVARKVGGADSYDHQLAQAAEAVRTAAEAGTLSPIRQLRLIEILSGAEAAEVLYNQGLTRR
ncbi:MAG: hypothetical protein EXR07_19795 [Acetobacteraceae bacterium]|nr:hypothetical protein [Acetobacteraceae bacterium]